MPRYDGEKHHTRKSALEAKRGDLDFRFCRDCLFSFNGAWDQSLMDYQVEYEASRSTSGYFNEYLVGVADDVNKIFDVSGKTVVEIGCGDGQFLKTLREKNKFAGYGFDPSLTAPSVDKKADLKFIRGYFKYDSIASPPDIIILRHILEHQDNPKSFFDSILAGSPAAREINIYIEIPAWEWIVDNNFIFVFSYEHCSYHSQYSLARIMESYGFHPLKIAYSFDNEYLQYFGVNKKTNFTGSRSRESIVEQTERFAKGLPTLLETCKEILKAEGAVLWGGPERV